MPDRIDHLARRVLNEQLDAVPRYLLMRDVLKISKDSPELEASYQLAMQSNRIAGLSRQQQADGSFGRFCLNPGVDSPVGGVNESAMIKAVALGMAVDHPVLQRLTAYFENMLESSCDCHKKSSTQNWPIACQLVLTACLSQLESKHPIVMDLVEKWRTIYLASFNGDSFDSAVFKESCFEFFGSDYEHWPQAWPERGISRYTLLILQDRLPFDVEKKLIRFVINETRGIYPVSNRSLQHFPLRFASKEGVRYILSLELLTKYSASAPFMPQISDWLWEQLNARGYWDLGPAGRDNRRLPMSDSWRMPINRELDSTVRVLSLLAGVQQSCELYNTACHFL